MEFSELTDSQKQLVFTLRIIYDEYINEFDPTPQYAFDDYNSPHDFDSWAEEELDQVSKYLFGSFDN